MKQLIILSSLILMLLSGADKIDDVVAFPEGTT